jgi:hypothetical protein
MTNIARRAVFLILTLQCRLADLAVVGRRRERRAEQW